MRKLVVRIGCVAAAVQGVALSPPSAGADEDAGAPPVTMTCERVDAPGRVHCDVEARVGAGESIAWGDVVITKTPAFVGALRGRIGPRDATAREPKLWRWALALVARSKGTGEVEGRVRVVVCKDSQCTPRETPVTAKVVVGD